MDIRIFNMNTNVKKHNKFNNSNNVHKASRFKKGFTLAEVMMATLILVLATGLVTVCIAQALKMFHRITRESEGQMLSASLCTLIENELVNARVIEGDGEDYTYFSVSMDGGSECRIVNDYKDTTGAVYDGVLAVRAVNDTSRTDIPFVSPGSKKTGQTKNKGDYVYGIQAESTISWNASDKKFTVKLTVFFDPTDRSAREIYADNTFEVIPTSTIE